MYKRIFFTFIFHLFSLSLILLPTSLKGPVVLVIKSYYIQLLDLVSFLLIFGGSVFLYVIIFRFLIEQQKVDKNQ